MARSDTLTILPLDRYAAIMQIHPSHFNQMQGQKAPQVGGCDEIWDQDGRDLLAWAMAQAEELIATKLRTYPAPTFVTNERIPLGLMGSRMDWRDAEVKTAWGYVEAFGSEQLTLLQADATVEYLDLDNDPNNREETAEIGGLLYEDLTACGAECQVAVFFRVADGAKDAADPVWEIKPLKVDIDGSTMRVRAESSMFVRPDLWDLTKMDCWGSDDENRWVIDFDQTNLVTKVDVYCRTVNTDLPVTLLWDGRCSCTGICNHDTQSACAYETDFKRGFFAPRPATTGNVDAAPTYFRVPEGLRVNYRAGFPLDRNCRMNANLERAIVKLTNVLLPEPPCSFCDQARIRWEHDRKQVDPLTPEAAGLPWDLYAQGALEAWRIVKLLAMGSGGKLGRY